ncbi:hypothetical protein PHMEG_00039206 [Phytophthora megakarya]|uniref:Reverse transcriptase n=1 Tax=Phytophthora megakarya TaxID=4795 RepID=A0A225UG14_9STRA|nr:hypothetical protein PHMEG_00039206 [Phytophthora megakarya]
MGPLEIQAERWRRIRVHQDADEYLTEIKDFLMEDFEKFSPRRLRKVAKVADLFVLDTRDVLYRLARSTRYRPRDVQDDPRLVVPKALRDDVLHYGHEDFQGGHQGITRTHKKSASIERVEKEILQTLDHRPGISNPDNLSKLGDAHAEVRPREYVFATIPRYVFGICDVQADGFNHRSRCRGGVRGTSIPEFRSKFDDSA